jgi:hypothetical protein
MVVFSLGLHANILSFPKTKSPKPEAQLRVCDGATPSLAWRRLHRSIQPRQLLPANSGAPLPSSGHQRQGPPRTNAHPMGASESLLARQPQQQSQWADEITTVSDGRRDAADEDPLLRRIRSLTIVRTNLPQSFSPRCGFFTANFTL